MHEGLQLRARRRKEVNARERERERWRGRYRGSAKGSPSILLLYHYRVALPYRRKCQFSIVLRSLFLSTHSARCGSYNRSFFSSPFFCYFTERCACVDVVRPRCQTHATTANLRNLPSDMRFRGFAQSCYPTALPTGNDGNCRVRRTVCARKFNPLTFHSCDFNRKFKFS